MVVGEGDGGGFSPGQSPRAMHGASRSSRFEGAHAPRLIRGAIRKADSSPSFANIMIEVGWILQKASVGGYSLICKGSRRDKAMIKR